MTLFYPRLNRVTFLDKSWIEEGIDLLNKYPQVYLVSPGDGGCMCEATLSEPSRARLTQNVSQQLFLVERERFTRTEFDIPWNWEKLAPGEPLQEFYWMLEGRIWRYLDKYNLWRAVLPDRWRYWHYNPWEPAGWVQAGRPT